MDSNITIKELGESYSGVDVKNRTISGKISTIYQDRDQEVVPPSALETDIDTYKLNPILILSHNHKSLPIGKATDIKFNNDHVWAKFYITKNPIGDEVLQLAQEGILNGFSSGFVPLEYKENPQAHEVPSIALKTSLGRKTKKLYKRCELVEVSMLAIPSNRQSLIDRTEKGNKAAGLVFKAFYGDKDEDLSIVLKELMIEENPPPTYTLKALWQENEHPRDNDGQFSAKPVTFMTDNDATRTPMYDVGKDKNESVVKKLDEVVQEQKKTTRATEDVRYEIKDKDSWSNWFKKWGRRAAAAVVAYLFLKHTHTGKYIDDAAKNKIREYLGGTLAKGYDPIKGRDTSDDIDKVLYVLNDIKNTLAMGRQLGLEKTADYLMLQRSYRESESRLRDLVGYGLKSLLDEAVVKKGLSSLLVAKEFKEEEHPRHVDGKFRNKSEGAGVNRAKATHVDEGHEIPLDKLVTQVAATSKKSEKREGFNFGHEKYKDYPEERPDSVLAKALRVGVPLTLGGLTFIAALKSKNRDVQELAVFEGLGVMGFSSLGYTILEKGDIAKRSENFEQAKISADDIVKACPKPHPNKKALTNIINLQVENRIYKDKHRTRFQQQVADYVNSDDFKKDLAERFGHLPDGGTDKIVIYSHPQMNPFKLENMMANNACYFAGTDKIYINLQLHDNLGKVISDDFTAKELILHEYAHSITMRSDEVQKRHLKEYEDTAKDLVGKNINIPSWCKLPKEWKQPNPSNPTEGSNVDIYYNKMGNHKRTNYKVVGYESKEQNLKEILEPLKNTPGTGKLFKEGYDNLPDDATIRTLVFKLEGPNGEKRELGSDGILQIMGLYGKFEVRPEDKEGMQKIAKDAIKMGDLDYRKVYGMSSLSEYISVKVEKGERI